MGLKLPQTNFRNLTAQCGISHTINLPEYSFLLGSSLFGTKAHLHLSANTTLILGIVNLIANYPPQ
jgi:hypothetical protein